jgi:hypothetical protein
MANTSGSGLPAYVTYPGDFTAPAPLELLNVSLWSFPLAADPGALRTYCDAVIKTPSGGAVEFLPLLPMVLMSLTEFPNAFFPATLAHGRGRERELSFSIPGVYVRHGGVVPDIGFALFMPFMYLDSSVAIAIGREEFGFFKQQGSVALPGDPAATGFTVDTYGCETFGPTVFWDNQRLLTMTDIGAAAATNVGLPWRGIADAGEKLATVLLEGAVSGLAEMVGGAAALAGLSLGKVPQIFLKQFRDIADGTRACYQAVTLASYTITRLHSVTPTNRYETVLRALDSTPVAATLGLSGQPAIASGLEVVMDLRLDPGMELWRA